MLLDSSFGTREMLEPNRLPGDDALFKLGHVIDLRLTAYERLKSRGIRPEQVTDIILTHLDNDHAGGLHDFPNATVQTSATDHQASLRKLRTLKAAHGEEVEFFCTHDQQEFADWTSARRKPDPLSASFINFGLVRSRGKRDRKYHSSHTVD